MKREMVAQDRDEVSILRACELLEVTRSGYYKSLVPTPNRDAELRQWVIQLTELFPEYGYRRIVSELRDLGYVTNGKRVLRLMRANDCLCRIRRRKTSPRTTDSDHDRPVYPDLTRDLVLTGPDQLWVADISYLSLQSGKFVYLASVMDAWSRRVVGWEIMGVQDVRLVLRALEKALASRSIQPGLVHHSDRGSQYASEAYVHRLRAEGIRPSMGRRGHPRDNAQAESLFATLKCEHTYRTEYLDLADAREQVSLFMDRYNHVRRHSALEYVAPARFEAERAEAHSKGEGDRSLRARRNAQPTPHQSPEQAHDRREATLPGELTHRTPDTTNPHPNRMPST